MLIVFAFASLLLSYYVLTCMIFYGLLFVLLQDIISNTLIFLVFPLSLSFLFSLFSLRSLHADYVAPTVVSNAPLLGVEQPSAAKERI